jgi:hypothetical protein
MDGQSSACHPLQAHLVLESYLPFRLILYWIRLELFAFAGLCKTGTIRAGKPSKRAQFYPRLRMQLPLRSISRESLFVKSVIKRKGKAYQIHRKVLPSKPSELRGWPVVAQFLGMPNSTIRRWAKEGMPVRREGRNVIANPEELNQWLQRTSGEAAGVHVVTPGSDLLKELRVFQSKDRSKFTIRTTVTSPEDFVSRARNPGTYGAIGILQRCFQKGCK